MIYADFERILVFEDNTKQNQNESYTNVSKTFAWNYGYKLVCVDDKCSEPFKSYLGEDAVYNFISSMTEESKYCSDVMKKHFNKQLIMTKEDNEDFKNSTKCWICDNDYIDSDVKVRDHCHISIKYRGFAHTDSNISLKLNHKIANVFHNLKNHDSTLIMQELGRSNLQVSVTPS